MYFNSMPISEILPKSLKIPFLRHFLTTLPLTKPMPFVFTETWQRFLKALQNTSE